MISVEVKGIEFFSKGYLGSVIKEETDNAVMEMAQEVKADFEKTVETWDEKPEFVVEKTASGAKVYTTDKVYRFLDKGTSVRRAVMPKGYRRKSMPGVIGSFQGNRDGTKIFVSKKITLPGIQPRKWSEMIQEKRRGLMRKFGRNLVNRIKQGISRLWRR
jgi:hypothetical protein